MASTFCLLPDLADKFKTAVKDGTIDINKLSSMSSEERRSFFINMLGERNAKEVNALFESKLLLKNQKKGFVDWAKQLTGIKPEAKRELSDMIERMRPILSPADEQSFLKELASKKLGSDISLEETGKIVEIADKIKSLENFTTNAQRIEYGRAKLELADYVNSLDPKKANLIVNIAGLPRTLMSSVDFSAPFNQGWGMMGSKEWFKSFGQMFKYAKNKDAYLNLQADIITRPTYKAAKKAGLRLTDLGSDLAKREEQFMSNLLDKVPGVSGSQRAYSGFLNKLRMDTYDKLVKQAEQAGEDVGKGSKVLEDIAATINNFTGGARVGKLEGGATPVLNAAFFSPRKIVSTLQMFNPVNYLNPNISPTARKQALKRLLSSVGITMTTLGLAKLAGIDVELDPRSSDFGKLRFGNSRIDISGGNSSYITLFSRITSGKTKTANGEKELGNNIGDTSKAQLIGQALRYKLSPNASLLLDAVVGRNAIGEDKTISQSALDRMKPMFLGSVVELWNDESTDPEIKSIMTTLGLFGTGLNTYELKPKKLQPRSSPRSGRTLTR